MTNETPAIHYADVPSWNSKTKKVCWPFREGGLVDGKLIQRPLTKLEKQLVSGLL